MPELHDLEGKVKHLDKGKWIGVGIAFVTLIIVYAAYKRNQAASAASSSALPAQNLGGGLPGAGIPATGGTPDLSSLVSSIQDQTSAIGALTASFSAPASATQPPSGGSLYDYSAIGPFANFIAQFGYGSSLQRAPDLGGLLYWEGQAEKIQSSGASPQAAENQVVDAINKYNTPGYKPPAGTTDVYGFWHPALNTAAATTPPAK